LAVVALAQFVVIIPALVLGHAGIGVPPQSSEFRRGLSLVR
jgi:hypothetical protein